MSNDWKAPFRLLREEFLLASREDLPPICVRLPVAPTKPESSVGGPWMCLGMCSGDPRAVERFVGLATQAGSSLPLELTLSARIVPTQNPLANLSPGEVTAWVEFLYVTCPHAFEVALGKEERPTSVALGFRQDPFLVSVLAIDGFILHPTNPQRTYRERVAHIAPWVTRAAEGPTVPTPPTPTGGPTHLDRLAEEDQARERGLAPLRERLRQLVEAESALCQRWSTARLAVQTAAGREELAVALGSMAQLFPELDGYHPRRQFAPAEKSVRARLGQLDEMAFVARTGARVAALMLMSAIDHPDDLSRAITNFQNPRFDQGAAWLPVLLDWFGCGIPIKPSGCQMPDDPEAGELVQSIIGQVLLPTYPISQWGWPCYPGRVAPEYGQCVLFTTPVSHEPMARPETSGAEFLFHHQPQHSHIEEWLYRLIDGRFILHRSSLQDPTVGWVARQITPSYAARWLFDHGQNEVVPGRTSHTASTTTTATQSAQTQIEGGTVVGTPRPAQVDAPPAEPAQQGAAPPPPSDARPNEEPIPRPDWIRDHFRQQQYKLLCALWGKRDVAAPELAAALGYPNPVTALDNLHRRVTETNRGLAEKVHLIKEQWEIAQRTRDAALFYFLRPVGSSRQK